MVRLFLFSIKNQYLCIVYVGIMQRIILYLAFLFLPAAYTSTHTEPFVAEPDTALPDTRKLYAETGLEKVVSFAAFEQALAGHACIERKNKDIVTIIDFSKPSTEKRLAVLDMKQRKLLFSSLVAHGKNSGGNYAVSFSNVNGSHKSSLGFYVTENTYQGKNGYSLILNGLEKGINDRAKERAIVMHGAAYANPAVIGRGGRLGRSFGCPALPQALTKPIINAIKGGTLLFIYANDSHYLSRSSILDANHGNQPHEEAFASSI